MDIKQNDIRLSWERPKLLQHSFSSFSSHSLRDGMKLLEIARSPKHSGDVRRKVDISHSLLPLVSEDVRRAGTLGEPLRTSAWKATIGLYFNSAYLCTYT